MLGIGAVTFFLTIMVRWRSRGCRFDALMRPELLFPRPLTGPRASRSATTPKAATPWVAVACLLLCGDVFVIADIFSTDSGNWPPLLLIATAVYFGVAYVHKNTLVLVFALIGLATWFGTQSRHVSGWGAYFLGLNYPMRFALVSPLVVLFGYLHERFRLFNAPESFVKAYYSIGSHCFLSLFASFPHQSYSILSRTTDSVGVAISREQAKGV